jgi:hypothetical protein
MDGTILVFHSLFRVGQTARFSPIYMIMKKLTEPIYMIMKELMEPIYTGLMKELTNHGAGFLRATDACEALIQEIV